MKRLGLLVAGVAVGLVLVEVLREQERRNESGHRPGEAEGKSDGLFAEIDGNTVRMYEVKDGHFCGYTDTKEFESTEKAMEWVVKETNAKMVIKS